MIDLDKVVVKAAYAKVEDGEFGVCFHFEFKNNKDVVVNVVWFPSAEQIGKISKIIGYQLHENSAPHYFDKKTRHDVQLILADV